MIISSRIYTNEPQLNYAFEVTKPLKKLFYASVSKMKVTMESNRIRAAYVLSAFMLLGFISLMNHAVVFAAEGTVLLNGRPLNVQTVNIDGRLLVPAKDMFESIGAKIGWNAEEKKITIQFGDVVLEAVTGKSDITRTELQKKEVINCPPSIIVNGTAYIPLGAVVKALNGTTEWNEDEQKAYVTVSQFYMSDDNAIDIFFRNKVIKLDEKENRVESFVGTYERTLPSVYGYDWNVYKSINKDFALIGMKDGKTAAYYTNAKNVSIGGIKPGMTTEQLNAELGVKLAEQEVTILRNKKGLLTVYRNSLDDYSVLAVMAKKTGFTDSYVFEKTGETELAKEQGMLLFDIINAERENRGLVPYKHDTALFNTARNHSKAMAEAGDLTIGVNDGSVFERLSIENVSDYSAASVNIGRDSNDAIEMFAFWMNNRIDQSNILSKTYNRMGAGAWEGGQAHKMYFTADFIESAW